MGDRANVIFKQGNKSFLGLYSHNGGYRIKESTAKALQRVVTAGRQKDISYGTRIAVSEIVGKDWEDDYNYGLNVGATVNEAIGDNGRDVVLVDWDDGNEGSVTVFDYNHFPDSWTVGEVKTTCTIAEFIQKWIPPQEAH